MAVTSTRAERFQEAAERIRRATTRNAAEGIIAEANVSFQQQVTLMGDWEKLDARRGASSSARAAERQKFDLAMDANHDDLADAVQALLDATAPVERADTAKLAMGRTKGLRALADWEKLTEGVK